MPDMMGADVWSPENAGVLWAITYAVMAAVFALVLFFQWRIFAKAGYPGALSLINLAIFIPLIGPIIVIALYGWFAFAKWPALHPPADGA